MKTAGKLSFYRLSGILLIAVCALLLDWWLPFRTCVTVCMLVLPVAVAIFLISLRPVKGQKKSRTVSVRHKAGSIALMVGVMALFESFRFLPRYGYASGKLFPFWKPAMIVAILSAAVFVIWILRIPKREEAVRTPSEVRKKGKGQVLARWQILLFAILIAVAVGFLLYALLIHVNFILDPTEPQPMTSEVVDKDYDAGGRRSPSSYSFDIVVNGQPVSLPVSHGEYHRGKAGDAVWFYRYEGALGVPFYLAESVAD